MAETKAIDFRTLGKNVKQQHQGQINKLTYKAEAELEFLDVVRDYMKSRAELETLHAKVSIFYLEFRKAIEDTVTEKVSEVPWNHTCSFSSER
jgi:BMFP domain-containing protein YqiC